ncbi:MAG TPA: phage terminase large subunit [Ktedonobacterales bacterium]
MNTINTNEPNNTLPPPSATLLARWTLNPVQAAFLVTDARFSFYVGGVGAGKTTAGALRALAWALDHPGSLGLIGAPTYPMLRDATQRAFFALLDEFLGDDGHANGGYTYHKSEQRLTLPNGSEILFRSLDEPDRVRGLTLAWFWLDEAPLCGHYAWQVLKGRLRQRGYPQMGWATGTPHGRDGYAYDFELSPRPNHALYRAATQENAANLPPDYISDLGLSGAFYDQEVLGLFTAFEGLVYTLDASEGGNVAEPPENKTFSRVIGGVDWGYTNPTAAAIFGIDQDERAWQLDEYYQRRAPLDAVVIPALLDLTRRYNVRLWRCGPDEPEHIRALDHALAEAKLPCRAFPAANAVRPGIQTITRLLAKREDGTRGLYISPRCVHTLAEYASYQYDSAPIPTGRAGAPLLPEQPLKQNDHLMDSTRYILYSTFGHGRSAQPWLDHMFGRHEGP